MAGTKVGALKAAKRNKQLYGENYYAVIGKLGGMHQSSKKGFGSNRELASEMGKRGGFNDSRAKNKKAK